MRLSSIHTWIFSILVILLPFLYYPFVFNAYEYPKFIFLIGVTYILCIISSCLLIFKFELFKAFKWDKLTLAVFGFLGIQLIANILGIDLRSSFLGSIWRYQGFITLLCCVLLYFLIRMHSITLKKQHLDLVFLFSNIGVSLYAVLQKFQIEYTELIVPTYNGRIVSTLGNPNFLGGFLVITTSFILQIKLPIHSHLEKALKCAVILLNVYVIYLTDSRAAFLAFFFVLLALFLKNNYKQILKMNRRLVITISVLILLLSSTYIVLNQQKLLGNRGSHWDSRSSIWLEGGIAILKRPLLGYGQENYLLISKVNESRHVDNAHNIFIETLNSSGILGLTLFIYILYLSLKRSSFVYKIAIIAFLIRAQFNPLSITEIAYFWIIIALSENAKTILPLTKKKD